MATDGPDPTPCDPDLMQNGVPVCMIHSISSNRLERFVKSIAAETAQRVDWYFSGGRAVVVMLGDQQAVVNAIERRKDELTVLMRETYPSFAPVGDRPPLAWL